MSKLRIGVIGAGHLGRIHVKLLSQIESAELVAIADPSPAVQQEMIQQSNVPVLSDYRKIIDQIDAAIVATPTRSHYEIAQNLLSHSIHTLIEKPITDCPYRAHQLVELAKSSQCVLSVGHVERFNPAIRLALNDVGRVKFVQTCRFSGYTFRSTDIGVVHDLMIHDLDLLNWIFRSTVSDCRAAGFSVFGGLEDIAQAHLQFECGSVANLTASRCSFVTQRTIQIFGTDAFAAVDLAAQQVRVVRYPSWLKSRQLDFQSLTPDQKSFVRDKLFAEVFSVQEKTPDKGNAILEEQQDWIRCIREGTEPVNSGENALAAIRLAQLILDKIDAHCWDDTTRAIGPLATFADSPSPDERPSTIPLPTALRPSHQRAA
jgi:predicted dehydrogenase